MNLKSRHSQFAPGFTLIEMLLSVVIIGALAGLSVPVYQSFQVRNDLDLAVGNLSQSFHRAQILSQAQENDASWGVRIQTGSIVVFRGASYAARDGAFDETIDLPPTITPSGDVEFIFAKLTGLPAASGTVTLSSSNGDSRIISINPLGVISY